MYFPICIALHIQMCKLISELGILNPGDEQICMLTRILQNISEHTKWFQIEEVYVILWLHFCFQQELFWWSVPPDSDPEFSKQHCCQINRHRLSNEKTNKWAKTTKQSNNPYNVKGWRRKMRKITPKKENHLQSTGRQMEETNGKRHLGGVPQKEKKHPGNMAAHTCNNTHIQTRTHASHAPYSKYHSPKQSAISLSAQSPSPPSFLLRALHPTCSEACWHTWLRDSAVLFLMMNYASAAVSLKNAITTMIRQMGLFCLAYAVHLLNGVE